MIPEQINKAREWLAEVMKISPPRDVVDTIEEALEIAMEKALHEARETSEQAEWRRLVAEQAEFIA